MESVEIKGAHGLIIVPENWNGSLFIYAHGYSADQRIVVPFAKDLTPANFLNKVNTLFQATIIPTLDGYASATTTFRSAGWYVKDSIKDIENLRRYFVKKYGKAKLLSKTFPLTDTRGLDIARFQQRARFRADRPRPSRPARA